jgi:hypothetical protein
MYSRITFLAVASLSLIGSLGLLAGKTVPEQDLEERLERLERVQGHFWQSVVSARNNANISSLATKADANFISEEIADPDIASTKLVFAIQFLYASANALHIQMVEDLEAAGPDHSSIRPERAALAYEREMDALRTRANDLAGDLRGYSEWARTRNGTVVVWNGLRDEVNRAVQHYPMPELDEFLTQGFVPKLIPLK